MAKTVFNHWCSRRGVKYSEVANRCPLCDGGGNFGSEEEKETCEMDGEPVKKVGTKLAGGTKNTPFSSLSKAEQKKSLKKRSREHSRKNDDYRAERYISEVRQTMGLGKKK